MITTNTTLNTACHKGKSNIYAILGIFLYQLKPYLSILFCKAYAIQKVLERSSLNINFQRILEVLLKISDCTDKDPEV